MLCCAVLCFLLQPDGLATLLSALRSLGCCLPPGLLSAASDVAVANMGSFTVPKLVELLQVRELMGLMALMRHWHGFFADKHGVAPANGSCRIQFQIDCKHLL
jgi:hypothetical protein